jgi:hypothetical protein
MIDNATEEQLVEVAKAALEQLVDEQALKVVVAWARDCAEWMPAELIAQLEEVDK